MGQPDDLRYCSYLLRIWQARGHNDVVWRASLEDARTGVRRGFATLDELIAFLAAETRADAADQERGDGGKHQV